MFADVYFLIECLEGYELDARTNEYRKRIIRELNLKLNAMEKRDAYTQSKVAPTGYEREEARQQYLSLVGIHRSFRWSKEHQESRP
jgi:hypothetical protein